MENITEESEGKKLAEKLPPLKKAIEKIQLVFVSIVLILGIEMILQFEEIFEITIGVVQNPFPQFITAILCIAMFVTLIVEYCCVLGVIVKIRKLRMPNNKKIICQLIPTTIIGIGTTTGTAITFFHIIRNALTTSYWTYYVILFTVIGMFFTTGTIGYILSKLDEKSEKEEDKKYLLVRVNPMVNGIILLILSVIYVEVKCLFYTPIPETIDYYYILVGAILFSITTIISAAILLGKRKKNTLDLQTEKGILT
ncbi:MAG: hypothetical protein ACFFDW_06505 [Candidatus Thorarchaeota archaeon]